MAIYEQGTPLSAMEFRSGDCFVVVGKETISGLIRYFTKGVASHAGLITTVTGDTVESLSTIKMRHLSEYIDQKVFIVRPQANNYLRTSAVDEVCRKWLGKIYPAWRFIPHLLGQIIIPFKRVNLIGVPVCSELVAFAEWKMGVRDGGSIWGVNPDDLMDEWVMAPNKYEIIYRGRLVK